MWEMVMNNMARNLFSIIGPGILVAATGVGAGDLATGAFTGAKLGMVVLWAVVLGAFFKFVLSEGLARWQLVTGSTLLEGAMRHFGRPAQYGFLIYFLAWSFMVAAALMAACGAAAQAIFPISSDPSTGKIIYGIGHSLVGLALVYWGGYRLFGKVMGVCIGLMFFTVITTAILLIPDWSAILSGLLVPTIPQFGGEGLAWTIALMGGVGGTVTILCYGYWIREEGRSTPEDLSVSRLDLAIAYFMTALFGLAMVIIGSHIQVDGRGASLIITLADTLVGELGLVGKWMFLIGAWGAVFSSLLGVWQSVPYLFADLWRLIQGDNSSSQQPIDTKSKFYRWYLYGLATIPMIGLWIGFTNMQKFYAIVGALFMPMLALTLLLLNGRTKWIGEPYRNHPLTTMILIFILFFFLMAGGLTIQKNLGL
jgi:Mn2+/Fe2+ NRAMP family transporter